MIRTFILQIFLSFIAGSMLAQSVNWSHQDFGNSFEFIEDDANNLWLASQTHLFRINKITNESSTVVIKELTNTMESIIGLTVSDDGFALLLLLEINECLSQWSTRVIASDDGFNSWTEVETPLYESCTSVFLTHNGTFYLTAKNEAGSQEKVYISNEVGWQEVYAQPIQNTIYPFSSIHIAEFFDSVYFSATSSIFKVEEESALLIYQFGLGIADFAISPNGAIWLLNNGLHKYEDGVLSTLTSTNSALPSNSVFRMTCDANGFVWVSFSATNAIFKTNGFVSTIYEDVEVLNKLMLHYSVDTTVFALDIGTERVFEYNNEWVSFNLNTEEFPVLDFYSDFDLCRDNSGGHWVSGYLNLSLGSDALPILCYFKNEEKIIYHGASFGLVNQDYYTKISLADDVNGSLWLGCENGLRKFANSQWEFFDISNSNLPTNNILDIAIDGSNNLWILSDLGLYKKVGDYYNYLGTPTGESYSADLVVLDNGTAWVLWSFDSLWHYDGNIIQEASTLNTPIQGQIMAIGGEGNKIAICSKAYDGIDSAVLNVYSKVGNNWSVYNPIFEEYLTENCSYISTNLSIAISNDYIYLGTWDSDYYIQVPGVMVLSADGVEFIDTGIDQLAHPSAALIEGDSYGVSILHAGWNFFDNRTAVSYYFTDQTTSVEDDSHTENLFLSVYPNPNPIKLQVISKRHSGVVLVVVRNLLGQIVYSKSEGIEIGENEINFKKLSAGTYSVSVEAKNEIITARIIVTNEGD